MRSSVDNVVVSTMTLLQPYGPWPQTLHELSHVLRQLTSAFGTWHYGGPEYFIARHDQLEVIVRTVEDGYYVLLAFRTPAALAIGLENLLIAARALRREMQ